MIKTFPEIYEKIDFNFDKIIISNIKQQHNIQTYKHTKTNMKITQEISEASGSVYEVQNYGEVRNDNILIIFGHEMSYNDLRDKSKNEDDYTELVMKYVNTPDNNRCTMVYFDDVMVLEIIRSRDYSSMMSYHLRELDIHQAEENEEDE